VSLFSFAIIGKAASGTMAILNELVRLRRGGSITTLLEVYRQSQLCPSMPTELLVWKCVEFYNNVLNTTMP
jgi:hypothetical protein